MRIPRRLGAAPPLKPGAISHGNRLLRPIKIAQCDTPCIYNTVLYCIGMIGTLPTTRTSPFAPPEALAEIRAERPVTRLAYPDGHEGWLVTGHAQARAVLADPRFSSRPELRHHPVP